MEYVLFRFGFGISDEFFFCACKDVLLSLNTIKSLRVRIWSQGAITHLAVSNCNKFVASGSSDFCIGILSD